MSFLDGVVVWDPVSGIRFGQNPRELENKVRELDPYRIGKLGIGLLLVNFMW
jgi:hypothetical protein